MEKSYSESYAAAGVDITAGYRSVELMKQYVARTMNEHCIGGLGPPAWFRTVRRWYRLYPAARPAG